MAEDNTKARFARRLRLLIQNTGMTKTQFVKLVQEKMPPYGRFERGNLAGYLAGRTLPRPIVLHALCQALGVSHEDLLPRKMAPTPKR